MAIVHSTKKATVGDEIGQNFEPEDIHVIRMGETEEEFGPQDRGNMERYTASMSGPGISTWCPMCSWIVLFVGGAHPVGGLLLFFLTMAGNFTLANYARFFSPIYLSMALRSFFYALADHLVFVVGGPPDGLFPHQGET